MDMPLFLVFFCIACLIGVASFAIYSFIVLWQIFTELEDNDDVHF